MILAAIETIKTVARNPIVTDAKAKIFARSGDMENAGPTISNGRKNVNEQ